jgi:hypothetical protein
VWRSGSGARKRRAPAARCRASARRTARSVRCRVELTLARARRCSPRRHAAGARAATSRAGGRKRSGAGSCERRPRGAHAPLRHRPRRPRHVLRESREEVRAADEALPRLALAPRARPAGLKRRAPGFSRGLGATARPKRRDRLESFLATWSRVLRAASIASSRTWPELVTSQVIGHSSREAASCACTRSTTPRPAPTRQARDVGRRQRARQRGAGWRGRRLLAWYLLENHGANERDRSSSTAACSTCCRCSQSRRPRDSGSRDAHNAHSSRTGRDADSTTTATGSYDEDRPTTSTATARSCRCASTCPAKGTHCASIPTIRACSCPCRQRHVARRATGSCVGSEGIDDDGDGRINEDSVGGYDMNRSWPSLWQPEHVQGGAGPYPLCWPETRCIASFVLAQAQHRRACRAFHNSGGMILRGPGHGGLRRVPARRPQRCTTSSAATARSMLPFYRYMVIWKDLYTVFGGFVNVDLRVASGSFVHERAVEPMTAFSRRPTTASRAPTTSSTTSC